MPRAEIIIIGNEILAGDVRDANGHYLCRQITGLGGEVTRAATVGDRVEDIGREVRSALERGPDLLLTAGGMGPTADDRTLEAVAAATDRPLEENADALDMVRRKYQALAAEGSVQSADLTDSRRKMAQLPRGGEPLPNPVGAAPGVLLRAGATTIVCLPGVPAELEGIFEGALEPVLRQVFGDGAIAEETLIVDTGDESLLAPVLEQVQRDCPEVYVKSRPHGFGPRVKIRVVLSARGTSRAKAQKRLQHGRAALVAALDRAGLSLATPQ
ncbi:MAG: competence/damage-inducible protein A [Armatimonadota bacterium]